MSVLFTEDIVKLLIAAGLGALIGLEREYHGKAAGLRTMMLISIGSTLFTVISTKLGTDAGRIASNIVTGIGFIGGGGNISGKQSRVRHYYRRYRLGYGGAGNVCGHWLLRDCHGVVSTGPFCVIRIGARTGSHQPL